MIQILHIENDAADRLIFKRYLNHSLIEHKLISAASLKDAELILKKEKFDVIFCDFNLSDGTALQFVENKIEFLEAPIIILSSKVEARHAVQSLKLGAFDFIAKDFLSSNEIAKLIANVERRKKEDKLRLDLEKRLDDNYANTRAFLDNTTDGIWSLDSNGILLMINQVAKTNLKQHAGTPPKIGEPFFDQIPDEFSQHWRAQFNKAIEGENSRTIHEYNLERNFVLECSCTPIVTNNGINGATFFAREVTERIQQEKKLRENEQNFRSIFENSDVPILLESRIDHTIVDLNDACLRLHNYKSGAMLGMSIFDTIPPDHRELSQKNYKLYLQGKIDILDSFVFTSDKKSIPVQISVAEIEFNGIPANLIFYQDISQRKETERKLQEAKDLAEKSAEFKSQFLANMSHEIRTPLNALVGFADVLEKSGLNLDQTKLVNIIQRSSEDLMSIIDDILDLTKIEAGKMTLHLKEFHLNNVLDKVEQLYMHRAQEKGLELELKSPKGTIPLLRGDEVKITQILNNLISNAIKFTEKGKVTLKSEVILIDDKDALCNFEITDTGMGISEKDATNIFDNFTQVDSSFQRQHHGTGLGLSIVKNLCILMGGSIELDPTQTKGSCFKVKIPLKFAIASDKSPKKEHKEVDLNSLKVLICEDHEVNILLNERIMESLGVNFKCAQNGKEGLELMKSFVPDVILMDLQMPIMDGYTAASAIREFSDTPIYAMSAHVLEEERQKCIDLGMNGFISKPVKVDDLKEILGVVATNTTIKVPISKWDELKMPTLTSLSDGDSDFVNTLFDIFISSTTDEVEKMLLAQKDEDLETIKKSAHKMKPSFITFEFKTLNVMADKIESGLASETEIENFISEVQSTINKIQQKQTAFNK